MMGYALARAARAMGHKVTLITGPVCLVPPKGMVCIKVNTTRQMFSAVKANLKRCNCLIMAAAVADFRPAMPSRSKIKKTGRSISITLEPTEDILAWAALHRPKETILVGFALEDKSIRRRAEEKLKGKGLDMIIANAPLAIGAEKVALQIKTKDGLWIDLPLASKDTQARRIMRMVTQMMRSSRSRDTVGGPNYETRDAPDPMRSFQSSVARTHRRTIRGVPCPY
jgi:phosphopantothenoylcysteine decarboxylase/phosphopantothenate--cysteine ligase